MQLECLNWPFRRWVRLAWWIICTLTFLALPLIIWDFFRKGMPVKYQAWFIGGIFCLISIPISIYEVAMHVEYYTQPRLQRHVIRILWMVPIYAVDAWFALRFRSAREYLDPIRECYEAYVIWNFFAYLMAYLEMEVGDVGQYLSHKPPMQHFIPFKFCLAPWPMGHKFLIETKKGVMNYVILRPITTTIGLITDMYGLYGQGQIDFKKSYVYLVTVTNFSQLWALYCLAQMYWACHKELEPIRPLSKFLCIKAVVFLTFWQGVILAILVSSGIIADESWSTYDQRGVATGIQDFLVCVEMFIAALAHAYAFPPKDYMDQGQTKGFLYNVKHMFDLRDVVQDMGHVVESHVDTAAEAVTSTTQAVLSVPKQAVKKATKGLKAAHSTLFSSSADDRRRDRSGNTWARVSQEDETDDEEKGRLLPPTQLQSTGEARESDTGGSAPSAHRDSSGSGGHTVPLLHHAASAGPSSSAWGHSPSQPRSVGPGNPRRHVGHLPDESPASAPGEGSVLRKSGMERINTEPNLIHLKPLHHRRSASRASENDDRSPIAGRAAGALGNWWGGSSAVSHVSSGMSMRSRTVKDDAQQPLLDSQSGSPLDSGPLGHTTQ